MKKSNRFARWFVLLCALMLPGLCACAGPGHVLPERTTEPVPEPVREEIPELAGAVDNARLRNKTIKNYIVHESPVLENFYNLYNMEVERCDDPDYPYRMWIFGESTGDRANPDTGYDSIFHGRGKDLDSWEMWCGERNGADVWDTTMDPKLWQPVLRRADKKYDSIHNGDPSVVYKDGRFYMAFSCVGFDDRDGRTYYDVTEDGRPVRKRRYVVTEHYTVMAFIELYKATGDAQWKEKAEKLYKTIMMYYYNPELLPPKFYPARKVRAHNIPMIISCTSIMMRQLGGDTSLYDKTIATCFKEVYTTFLDYDK
ncbi:MAG: hypothetical protein II184_04695, partial [Clostridia bacterium]|nr:hypothetical protein [Clostridia bacterium]